jgi:hypothetical protein
LGVAGLCLVSDDTEDVGLPLLVVDGIAQGLAIEGQALVGGGHLRAPLLQRGIERSRIDAREHIANPRAAGHLVAAVAIPAAKARTRRLAEVLRPSGNGLVTARPAQHRGGGDGEHDRQGMAAPLRAARIGHGGEERRQ